MRGQHGPCMVPGNYPAARRFVRSRKPPPIILWSIGIITCLLFIGAAAMLTVGYLNPFGTVGLSILGVGAVVYFGAILFLVLSCLWVERKYPGMQPLSFKIYSRKPNRVPPTTFTNPNISGQMPADSTPSYRMHNELPIEIPGINDAVGKRTKLQEKKDNNPPSHGSSQGHVENSTALDDLEEEENNGGIHGNYNSDIRVTVQTNNDNVSTKEDMGDKSISSDGIKENSLSQQEQLKTKHGELAAKTLGMDQSKSAQPNGSENDNNVYSSPKRERKVKIKTHHIEVPFEDYPSSDSSMSQSKKNESQDIQGPNPKDNSQHIKSITTNENSPSTGGLKSTSSPKIPNADKLKETSSRAKNLSYVIDEHSHQRTKTDIKQESSNQTGQHKSRFHEKDEIPPSSSQTTGSSPAHERKQSPVKHQNNQSSQKVTDSTTTLSASSSALRRPTEQESHAPKLQSSAQRDSSQKSSSVSAMLDAHTHNSTNPKRMQEKSHKSSPVNISENMVPHNNNHRHDQQAMTTPPKHRKQNLESPGGSPTRAQKLQSSEKAQNIPKNNADPNSPPINRRAGGPSSPPRSLQKRRDHLSKEEKTQEQSLPIQTFSSNGRKKEIQKTKIHHASLSSQSSDGPPSFSSSPPKQHQRSPNRSPKLPGNGDHTSRTTAFHSTPRNEEFSKRQSRQSSPSSQSSDVPSSPSSSLKKTHGKSSEWSIEMQGHKDIPGTNVALPSIIKKDDLHSSHSKPSSSVNSSLPASSPLSAKKLLHYKKKEINQKDPNKSIPQEKTHK